ncbi:MAG: hypothetical protein WCJ39_04000 [bacterium]
MTALKTVGTKKSSNTERITPMIINLILFHPFFLLSSLAPEKTKRIIARMKVYKHQAIIIKTTEAKTVSIAF